MHDGHYEDAVPGSAGPTPDTTLTALLAESVVAAPDSTVIVDAQAGTRPVTRAELWQRVVAVRDDLHERGVGQGDCVAVWLPNWSDAVVWQFAVAALGAHVIGMNTRYGPADVAHVLRRARPAVVALAHGFLDLDLGPTLRAAVDESGVAPRSVAVLTGPGEPPASDLSAYGPHAWTPRAPASDAANPSELDGAPDALAVAFTTSGSTGLPKLAAHRSSGVATHVRAVAAAGGWDATSVTLVVYPFSGVFGYTAAMTAVTSGGVAVLEPVFTADVVLRHCSELGVTHLAAADDITVPLMTAWRRDPLPLERFSHLLVGDFYGNAAQVAAWAESETGTPAYGIYGSSELFALVSFWHAGDPVPGRWRAGGHPVSAAIGVRAVDTETGAPVAAGEVGELQFRGYLVVDDYLGDDDGAIRARSFTDDGWFRSGDLGSVEGSVDGGVDGGAFVFRCRAGDSLRLRGYLVEPAEIEARLIEHPAVARAKVVGVDRDGQTRAVAFVEAAAGHDPDPTALRDWCAAALAAFKVPESVRVLPELPTTVGTNGSKIRADVLRAMAAVDSAERSEGHPSAARAAVDSEQTPDRMERT